MLFEVKGKLEYTDGPTARVLVDQSISDYYRDLIPQYKNVLPQRYGAHITVVRTALEHPQMDVWKKHDGEIITFFYDNEIRFDDTYYWLNIASERIGDIREELGLPRFRGGSIRDDGTYHMTIGNIKAAFVV